MPRRQKIESHGALLLQCNWHGKEAALHEECSVAALRAQGKQVSLDDARALHRGALECGQEDEEGGAKYLNDDRQLLGTHCQCASYECAP